MHLDCALSRTSSRVSAKRVSNNLNIEVTDRSKSSSLLRMSPGVSIKVRAMRSGPSSISRVTDRTEFVGDTVPFMKFSSDSRWAGVAEGDIWQVCRRRRLMLVLPVFAPPATIILKVGITWGTRRLLRVGSFTLTTDGGVLLLDGRVNEGTGRVAYMDAIDGRPWSREASLVVSSCSLDWKESLRNGLWKGMLDAPGWRTGSRPGEPASSLSCKLVSSAAALAIKSEGHCKLVGAISGKLGDTIMLSPSSVASSLRFRRRLIPSTISKPVGRKSVQDVSCRDCG